MEYRRYASGHYARTAWIRCTECSPSPDKPHFVWQGSDRETNFSFQVNAVMQHEIAVHASNPTASVNRK